MFQFCNVSFALCMCMCLYAFCVYVCVCVCSHICMCVCKCCCMLLYQFTERLCGSWLCMINNTLKEAHLCFIRVCVHICFSHYVCVCVSVLAFVRFCIRMNLNAGAHAHMYAFVKCIRNPLIVHIIKASVIFSSFINFALPPQKNENVTFFFFWLSRSLTSVGIKVPQLFAIYQCRQMLVCNSKYIRIKANGNINRFE